MKKTIILFIVATVIFYINAEPVDINYANPEIKKMINEAIRSSDEALVLEDLTEKYDWKKYYQKTFKNIDCFNEVHEGIVVYFFKKPNRRVEILAVFIELKNKKPLHYLITEGFDINQIINDATSTRDAFNGKCLGD